MLDRPHRRAERVVAAPCLPDPAVSTSGQPRHVALIPDGNRRWARAQGLGAEAGHRHGFLVTAPVILDRLFERGCDAVSLWLFSTDNWRRAPKEVADLMAIYQEFLALIAPLCARRGLRVLHWGRADRVPSSLMRALEDLCSQSQHHAGGLLILALDYGGADDLIRATRTLLTEQSPPLDEAVLLQRLSGLDPRAPPLDLVLRTSGERRLSGFAPLAAAMAELCFLDTCFPALSVEQVDAVVADFARREQRRGV